MLRLWWVSFVFLSLNLHLCVVVMRRKISPIALFSQLYHTECYERDKYDFAFIREILDFFEVFSFDMKHNIAKSYLSSFKTFTCMENSGWGDHRGSSSLASCTRQGQAKTCVKPVWCVNCNWEKKTKQTQTHYSCLTKLSGSISHSLAVLCSPPNSGVVHICFRQVYVLLLSLLCVNKDINENWGWRRNETHIRPNWPRKEAPVVRAVGLALKDCQGTSLCLLPWLLWLGSWSLVRRAGGKQAKIAAFSAPGFHLLQEKPLLPADGEGWQVQGDSRASMLHPWL